MRTRHFVALLIIVVLGLSVLVAILFLNPQPYRRLEGMRANALRLSQPGSQETLSDRLVGLLHQTLPREYYLREWESEQKELAASGLLTETRIAIAPRESRHAIYEELRKVESKTGAYWWAIIDLTNRVVTLSCKPGHVASFTSALTNE